MRALLQLQCGAVDGGSGEGNNQISESLNEVSGKRVVSGGELYYQP